VRVGRIAECPRLQQIGSSDDLSFCCKIAAVTASDHCRSLRGHAVRHAMPSVASGRHSRQVGKNHLCGQGGWPQVAVISHPAGPDSLLIIELVAPKSQHAFSDRMSQSRTRNSLASPPARHLARRAC
jgi:hypothetical protein